ncbi:hypothetical protein HAZT_HAZT006239 [Hyalella azteca]|uniref:RING-type E3 ubiquitin transferase n=1 Tax=Hyalella azteca TaxID=294128 RepID=A0A6A0GSS5_HYAAZ|nr:hypothetical protein HAZT_HAZT006239 [Hyalella azteca]
MRKGSSRRLPASDKDEDRQAAGSHLTDARVARDSSAHAVVDLQPKKLYTRQKFDHNCRNDGCQMLMSPPLPQCRKGHIVCSQCKLNSKNVCPICKQRYAEGCNVMMEQVYHLLKLPCRFSSHGCTRLIVQAEKTEHEAYCSHRPVSCNYANNGCSEQLPYSLMLEHVKTCDFKTNIIVGVI